jgi:hypothetical protein
MVLTALALRLGVWSELRAAPGGPAPRRITASTAVLTASSPPGRSACSPPIPYATRSRAPRIGPEATRSRGTPPRRPPRGLESTSRGTRM